MLLLRAALFVAIAAVTVDLGHGATDKVVCYHGSWSYYRNGNGKFTIQDIDTSLCTHLIYAFVGVSSDGSVRILDPWLEEQLGNLASLAKLKSSKLKTLVAIGGWNEGSQVFSTVVASKQLRTNLINSAISLIERYGFDGFDLDWEYPAQRGGAAADKANFVLLLKEFRAAFDKKNLLLTAAVAAAGSSVDLSYDVPALSKYLDIINVMAYDLHGSYDGVTGQNAPLYASSIDVTAAQKQLNVDACIRGWISRGAAPAKIALGLGAYGRSFTLTSASNNKLGASAPNPGLQGPYTLEAGMLGYNEIVEKIAAGGWTEVWDDQQKVPYIYKGNQWVGYDNPRSIALKTNYAKELGLGGVMLWSIETEDFRGVSGTKYPLLRAVKTALAGQSDENIDNDTGNNDDDTNNDDSDNSNNNNDSGSDDNSNNNNNNNNDSGSGSSDDVECTQAGYIKNVQDCSTFFYCLPSNGGFQKLPQSCPSGLQFNSEKNVCDWPENVKC